MKNPSLHINSFTRFVFSLLTLFILLGALPIGVYLVGQKTAFLPEATIKQPESTGETSFTVEKDQKMSSESGQIAVDILARSDNVPANLFAARISFPANLFAVSAVATSAATLPNNVSFNQEIKTQFAADKWLQSSVDGGQITLIGGVATPGLKTNPAEKYVLATIFLTAKTPGQATFHFDPDSSIFDNSSNILPTRVNDATFDVASTPLAPLPSPKPPRLSRPPTLALLAPIGGELVSYNQPLTIKWTEANLDQVGVALLLNGQLLGKVASASASLGELQIKPADYILPTFLSSTNTFKIRLTGTSAKGDQLTDLSRGPFAITTNDGFSQDASQAARFAERGGDADGDGAITLSDVSKLLSSYGPAEGVGFGVDLNGDQAVNDVDFYLLRNLMLQRGLIQ